MFVSRLKYPPMSAVMIGRVRRLAVVLLALGSALLTSGCGAIYADEDAVPTRAAMRYPLKGDNKPHAGVAEAHAHAIHGIDVARYQSAVDWTAVKRAGTRFAYIKATEGGDYVDPYFRRNWETAKAMGIPRGAYHFVYWCRPAGEQAAWFIRNVPRDPDALPPVLDLEWNNHSRTCSRKVSREDALAKTRILLAAMERHTGKVPVIYTDINFHRDVLAGEPFDNAFWLRSTAAHPRERYANRRWTFWQWTQTGTVPGIRGEVDRNVFYGSDRDWATFLATGCDPRDAGRLGLQGRCRSGGRPVPQADPAAEMMIVQAPMPVAPATAALAPMGAIRPPAPVYAAAYDEDGIGALLDTLQY